jgi:GDP-4-dehydro-6-deoxy-D-mannose reductase
MRILITGVSGFAGSHMADYCLAQPEVEVVGHVRSLQRIGHAAHFASRLQLVEADLRQSDPTQEAVAAARADLVLHLAGQAYVPAAFRDPVGTFMDNAIGQIHLIQAILRHTPSARLLVVGSATEYGKVEPHDLPIGESVPLRPLDPYAVSKVAQDLGAYQYFASHHLQAVRVRPFNHIGPRQSDEFAVSHFAHQIARIEAGLTPPVLPVGVLSDVRDYTDVRDTVRAYYAAATNGHVGEVYNVGSGQGRRVDEILGMLDALSTTHFQVQEDPARMRPSDVPALVCNARKLHRDTGWAPQIPIERTLRDVLDYWRADVRRTAEPAAPRRPVNGAAGTSSM